MPLSPNSDESKFLKLFWAARREHLDNLEGPNHQACLAFCREKKWPWAETLLLASRKVPIKDTAQVDDALALLENVNVPAFAKGSALHLKGWCYQLKNDFDAAIHLYKDALNDTNHSTPGYTRNTLGTALFQKGRLDEAIDAFQKALSDGNYDTPDIARRNLGLVYLEKGDVAASINAFRKAIESAPPRSVSSANSWTNLGTAYLKENNFSEAINALKKALETENYEYKAFVLTNLGYAYKESGDSNAAIEAFREVPQVPNLDPLQKEWVELQLLVLERNIPKESLTPDDRTKIQRNEGSKTIATGPTISGEESPEQRILSKRADGTTKYDEYLKSYEPAKTKANCLSILREWSSAVTVLEGDEGKWRGGGYFLSWQGKGIVMDPGFDFVRNFHEAKFHASQINVVIVSHNHTDHNIDLKRVDDLMYQMCKRRSEIRYILLADDDTRERVQFDADVHRSEGRLDYNDFRDLRSQTLNLHETADLPFRVTPFKVVHAPFVPRAVGVVLELLDDEAKPSLKIGYTGDTEYFDRLPSKLEGCDILIAHISEPSQEELEDENSDPRPDHLGYRGLIKLLKNIKNQPSLILIGEFWPGLEDTRIELIQAVRERTGLKNIYPACLGMKVGLEKPAQIYCTKCDKPSASIHVTPPKESYGNLSYLCTRCMIPPL